MMRKMMKMMMMRETIETEMVTDDIDELCLSYF